MTTSKDNNELLTLMNVGKATLKDFNVLGIGSIEELSKQNADDLYLKLQKTTGKRHDPCVWDVFAAAIHEAKTGQKTPWWEWSKVRKQREASV